MEVDGDHKASPAEPSRAKEQQSMAKLIRNLAEMLRYFLVSILALAGDMGLFALLTGLFGVHHLIANPVSFTAGLIIIYFGSVLWAFEKRSQKSRFVEFFTFALIGAAGLLVNEAALWALADGLGLVPLLAKGLAAGCSFLFNFVVRKLLLFS